MSEEPTTTDIVDEEVFEFPAKEIASEHYEILILIAGTVSEQEATASFEEVKKLIQSFDGEITLDESLGRKSLGYTVANTRSGNYFVAEFNLLKPTLKDLQEKLRIRKDLTRFLIVKKKVKTAEELVEEQRVREKIAVRKQVQKQEAFIEAEKVDTAKRKAAEAKNVVPAVETPVLASATATAETTPATVEEKTVDAVPVVEEPAKPVKTLEDIDAEIEKLLSDDLAL